jgi:hypothetical protein
MLFGEELAAKVLAGEKTVTRRRAQDGQCRYRVNRSYAVQTPIAEGPGKGRGGKELGRIAVLSIESQRLGAIFAAGDAEPRREGFATVEAFVDYWRGIHGEFDPGLAVWRIQFRLIPVRDYPLWEGGGG